MITRINASGDRRAPVPAFIFLLRSQLFAHDDVHFNAVLTEDELCKAADAAEGLLDAL